MIRCSRTGSHRNGRNVNRALARQLIELNNRFYRENASSFSATRQAPWRGWDRVVEELIAARPTAATHLSVLDVACGNRRFARFLAEKLPHTRLTYLGIDNCSELSGAGDASAPSEMASTGGTSASEVVITCDLLSALLEDEDPLANIAPCDLLCCFGFMHHVPGAELRSVLAEWLVAHTQSGGIIALSCWRFMDDKRLATQARAVTRNCRACHPDLALEPNDYFLGWQGSADVPRYCHYIDEWELDDLSVAACASGARELERFNADGDGGVLNRYLLLQKA